MPFAPKTWKAAKGRIALSFLLLAGFSPWAHASFIINVTQNGTEVDADGSGSINTAGLSPYYPTVFIL